MKNRKQKQQIIEDYIKAYNKLDVDGMIKSLDDQVIFQNITNNKVDLELIGKAAFDKHAKSILPYFEKREQIIDNWKFADENHYILDISYNAVLAQDFPNGMKKGDQITLKGQSEFKFQGNKIIEIIDRT